MVDDYTLVIWICLIRVGGGCHASVPIASINNLSRHFNGEVTAGWSPEYE